MIAIVLAAGYGSRMYPLTLHTPKVLLRYNGKFILDYLMEDLLELDLKKIIIVTNQKYYTHFKEYSLKNVLKINVINDGSTSNENRVGAGNDLINTIINEKINDDIIVCAADNILNFSLKRFIEFFYQVNQTSVMYYEEKDNIKISKTGIIEMDKDYQVISYLEKPLQTNSKFAVPPFYCVSHRDLMTLVKLKYENSFYDSPGQLMSTLFKFIPMKAYHMDGSRMDISTINVDN